MRMRWPGLALARAWRREASLFTAILCSAARPGVERRRKVRKSGRMLPAIQPVDGECGDVGGVEAVFAGFSGAVGEEDAVDGEVDGGVAVPAVWVGFDELRSGPGFSVVL
jgi:hypothetical protein